MVNKQSPPVALGRSGVSRRHFLAAAVANMMAVSLAKAAHAEPRRVAVIGHTGRGDFGHGLDTVWKRLPETSIVAVADADEAGLIRAQKRLDVGDGYADYREMLRQTAPELVAVCPRRPDQHRDMIVAAAEHGAKGIYVEKPFCRSPREADEITAACQEHGAKVAVAHRNRWHPTLQAIDRLIGEGGIGKVLEIRGRGKGDRRGGGEDLWVLGSHVLNLMQYFGGDAIACSATLLQDGRPVTRADVGRGNEALGPLAGNEVHARFRMQNGIAAFFDSVANDRANNAGFGLQIIGSEGIVDVKCDRDPLAHLVPGNPFQPSTEARRWIPITSAGVGKSEPIERLADEIAHHVLPVRDLIESVDHDRNPRCDLQQGSATVEMICAVFESHRQGGREITFPLAQRDNALSLL